MRILVVFGHKQALDYHMRHTITSDRVTVRATFGIIEMGQTVVLHRVIASLQDLHQLLGCEFDMVSFDDSFYRVGDGPVIEQAHSFLSAHVR